MIGLCTDSNSQIPKELVDRYGIEVVGLSVTLDGQDFIEGVDIDADAFYERFEAGVSEVSTAAPSPGRFVQAYAALQARGATEILSVHISASTSATLEAAELARRQARIPVRLVDTSTASFGVACCVWEAARLIADGAGLDEAAQRAEEVGQCTGNVFVVKALDLARRGGRLRDHADMGGDPADIGEAVPVLSFEGGRMEVVATARDLDDAARAMAEYVRKGGSALRVGVGAADAATTELAVALEERLAAAPEVTDIVRYRIGPSVGAHTGPGTVGAFFYSG
ncbi:MAG: DegV family protein [Acidimicrobiales bacterium]